MSRTKKLLVRAAVLTAVLLLAALVLMIISAFIFDSGMSLYRPIEDTLFDGTIKVYSNVTYITSVEDRSSDYLEVSLSVMNDSGDYQDVDLYALTEENYLKMVNNDPTFGYSFQRQSITQGTFELPPDGSGTYYIIIRHRQGNGVNVHLTIINHSHAS